MRIVHGSDWHWVMRDLPEADLYVFTGDMMPNYPVRDKLADRLRMDCSRSYRIEAEHERIRQSQCIKHFIRDGGFRSMLGSPTSPIIAVRGNHDFIDISLLFGGCNFLHEFIDNETVDVFGLKVSGHRGIPFIYGEWSDEVQRPDLMDRVRAIPQGIDLLLTHYPPALTLDCELSNNGRIDTYGLEGMSHSVFNKLNNGGVHCFGHIHGSGGRMESVGDVGHIVTFSNAATTFNIIDI